MTAHFTRHDDELIMANSRRELAFKRLRAQLQGKTLYAIEQRAVLLGVRLYRRYPRPAPVWVGKPQGDSMRPSEINDDKLLKRLMEVHGDGTS